MRFTVAPEVFASFPGMRIAVAIAHGVDNTREDERLVLDWNRAWNRAAEEGRQYGNAQSHPRVRPWRDAFRMIGMSGKEFPSSIEALLRRAMKGGEPFRINSLVDFYNTVSLDYIVPAGGFDLDDIDDLTLRLTRPGDTFLSLDADEPVQVPAGEVAYATGSTVLTRHFVWRQSREGLLTPTTKNVILISEVLAAVGRDVADAVRDAYTHGVHRYFEVAAVDGIVQEDDPQLHWS